MLENYVTFKQATELKELGLPQEFDCDFQYYYKDSGELILCSSVDDIVDNTVFCPTQSQVQDWLRDTKEIYTYGMNTFDGEFTYIPVVFTKNIRYILDDRLTNSHTQAISDCIDKCIEFLKQNKQKNG